jgi:biopolymer transport protein ExbD/biopolymer transport protein TolR
MRKQRPPSKLFSDFNTLQFAGVMGMVLFVILLVFMKSPVHGGRVSVDLPKVNHPVSLPGAAREDAMIVTVSRDGKIFLGVDQMTPMHLPAKIADRLTDQSVERKVYIAADMRARWGVVKLALVGVRAAGILRVAFVAHQQQSAAFPR